LLYKQDHCQTNKSREIPRNSITLIRVLKILTQRIWYDRARFAGRWKNKKHSKSAPERERERERERSH